MIGNRPKFDGYFMASGMPQEAADSGYDSLFASIGASPGSSVRQG
jgi:hypothetical protein